MDVLTWILTNTIPFLLVLTLVVTVHELGHFLTARAFGTRIDSFSIGFGKSIARFTDKGGVEWRVGWLPLGGYVKFSGDENAASVPDADSLEAMRRGIVEREGPGAERHYFHFKPIWQRALIVAAGPLANFALAIVLFTFLLSAVGHSVVPPRVGIVDAGSPAERAGFRAGDLILEAEGRKINDFTEIQQVVALRSGTPTDFLVQRGGERLELTVVPVRQLRPDGVGGQQKIGTIGLRATPRRADIRHVRYPIHEAIPEAVRRTWDVLDTTLTYLGRVVTGRESGDQLGGPLRIAQTSGSVAQQAVTATSDPVLNIVNAGIALLSLSALLSVGIGFLNLLPVPVLDGGHLLFYAYEAMARRPLGAKVQAAGYRVGLALLLGLMVFATWNDLQQLRVFSFLGGLFS
jgi:regulator of sigma E protease